MFAPGRPQGVGPKTKSLDFFFAPGQPVPCFPSFSVFSVLSNWICKPHDPVSVFHRTSTHSTLTAKCTALLPLEANAAVPFTHF
jgi:hypothetical protein